ncbi:putative MULE transposase domain-containing protein [Helianthus annuus]|nr:putative MULE transposase domain-containing protein [Helianthus annuus]KAJ0767125.1 putative MULE transposase domain-containing protein [Helianthus annuus]
MRQALEQNDMDEIYEIDDHYPFKEGSIVHVESETNVYDSVHDEDDSDYIVDNANRHDDPEVDMRDFRLHVDLDVEDTNIGVLRDIEAEDEVLDNEAFDSGSDSDENATSIRRRQLNYLRKSNETTANFYLGQIFGSKEEVKQLIKAHAVETRRIIKIIKDDNIRVRAVCQGALPSFETNVDGSNVLEGKGPGINVGGRGKKTNPHQYQCPWVVLISKDGQSESWMVKTLITEHKCLQTRNIYACTSTFLSQQMLEQIDENPEIPVKAVQEQFQRRYELAVSKMKAYRAKIKAKKQVQGDYVTQYARLRDYVNELLNRNPGSTVKIEVEPVRNPKSRKRIFKRIYVCLGALKQGFKAIGRDLLGLDGAFMKGPFPGQVLTTVGIDPNNGIYPLAYAVVEAETLSSWTWFLECVGDDLELARNSNFTFISDRQKGILPAIQKLFPCAEHRFCLRHIHENMKATFKGKLYKDMLWKAATYTTVVQFQDAMDELKKFNANAHLWLSKIPTQHWSRSHFSGRALSDVLLNNMCEVLNGKIVDGRDKPIISALEFIRKYLMRRIVTVLETTERSDGLLTPHAT